MATVSSHGRSRFSPSCRLCSEPPPAPPAPRHPSPWSACLCLSEACLCVGCGGEQPDSPESRQQIVNTGLLTSVSQNVHSDVWLLTVHPEARQEGGERKERRRLTVETAMDCPVFCLMGGWLNAHCTPVVCSASALFWIEALCCVRLVITCAVCCSLHLDLHNENISKQQKRSSWFLIGLLCSVPVKSPIVSNQLYRSVSRVSSPSVIPGS